MGFWRKVFFHSPFKYLTAFIIAIVASVIILISNGYSPVILVDSIITSGIIVTCIGILLLCVYYGAFDTFAYGFHSIRNRKKRKFEDLVQYTQIKQDERNKKGLMYMPFIVVGILYALIGVIINALI